MPKTSSFELGKTTQAGTWKTKGKAEGKHIEICEEAATCSAQDLRENILSEMRAIGKNKLLYYWRQIPYFPGHAVFCPKLILWYIWLCRNVMEFEWVDFFRRSRYEKRAGSRSLSHWQVSSQEAQVIPQRSIFFLSLSLSQICSEPLCRHTRNKRELLRNRSRVKTSGPCYDTCYFQRCWQITVNTCLEKINATNLFSSITLRRNNLFFFFVKERFE